MIVYTNKNLSDVLPLAEKNFLECGINDDATIQVLCENKVHSFLTIIDTVEFNNSKKGDFEILTQQAANEMILNLKEIEKIENEELRKQTVEYKMDMILEQLSKLNENMNTNNSIMKKTLE